MFHHLDLSCSSWYHLILSSVFPVMWKWDVKISLVVHACKVTSVMSDSLWPYGPQPTRLLCPRDSPRKNTGVGSHSLLQGIFPSQGLNPGLLHCWWIFYHLSDQGSPLYILAPPSPLWNSFSVFFKRLYPGLTSSVSQPKIKYNSQLLGCAVFFSVDNIILRVSNRKKLYLSFMLYELNCMGTQCPQAFRGL